MRRQPVRLLTLVCVLAAFQSLPTRAQDAVEAYPAGFFAANQPATAYEMVSLVPGFHIQLGDRSVRGFSGTVGNVLIDGQLPTSKEDSAEVLLRRIPAASVDRIELIRGAADMHGYPVLDNVVREGRVIDPDSTDPNVPGTRAVHEALAHDSRVTWTTLQTVGVKKHDGFTIALVN